MPTDKKTLGRYTQRRDFKKTPEPAPHKKTKKKQSQPIFVIQKHEASHLHYDFRLCIGERLVSWAVPKGLPRTSNIKRLAVHTEDHPLEYASFEGTIPKGNYGAGVVTVLDHGTYTNIKEHNGLPMAMETCLKKGLIEITLHGKKYSGNYALVRTKLKGKDQWLIFKMTKQKKVSSSSKKSTKQSSKKTTITNADKILFPKNTITKLDVVDYYTLIAPYMLPHMKNRAVTMHRFPDGISSEGFYQKNASEYFPAWIKQVRIPKAGGGHNSYVVCNTKNTLRYLANQACITPHLWLSKIDDLNHPDRMIFDLDPASKTSFDDVKTTALALHKLLLKLGLTSFVMSTGSRGLHIVVPLKRTADFDTVRTHAHAIAQLLVAQNPDTLTIEPHIKKRRGKLFVDTTRNAFAQTTVAPYAIRALPGAPVAIPLAWNDLKKRSLQANSATIETVTRHIKKLDNPWKKINNYRQSLRGVLAKINNLSTGNL